MAAAYSMNLRMRVLKDADAGLSSKELAERYHASRAWVDALEQRRRATGAFAPLKQTKCRGRALVAAETERLAALVGARSRCDVDRAARGPADVSGLTTIWRALNQLDLSFKENGSRRRTATARHRG